MRFPMALTAGLLATSLAVAADDPARILITNVNVFDGKTDALATGRNVLVEGSLIKTISSDKIKAGKNAIVIDGDGRTLMPGLIDGHAHVMINHNFGVVETRSGPLPTSRTGLGARRRSDSWSTGLPSVRDMGGPAFAPETEHRRRRRSSGPSIYPVRGVHLPDVRATGTSASGAMRGFSPNDAGDLSNFERMGIGIVADGVPEVLKATRLNLRNGATQIKIMGGGGGSSRFDPIDTTQYSKEEICAIVEAAKPTGAPTWPRTPSPTAR